MKKTILLAVIFGLYFSCGVLAKEVTDCPIETKIDLYLSHGKHIGLSDAQIKELKAVKTDLGKLHSRFEKALTADQKNKCDEMCKPADLPKLEGYHKETPEMNLDMPMHHH